MKPVNQQFEIRKFRPSLLAAAVGLALATGPAMALDLSTDEVSIQLDTTISYGVGFRVSDRDNDLVAKSHFDPTISTRPLPEQIDATGRFSANSDDGNLNFDQWDPIFNQARVTSELEISYRNYGAFLRGNYFYDFTLNDMDELSSRAKDKVGERARLLDAYVWGDFEIGDRFLTVRLGRQVVSWGESTFIPGGINAINPVDVTAIRTAGAELRDAFLPLNMAWATMDITPNLSLEGLVMFEWDRVEAEPAGTFFATNDFGTDGGTYAMLNFGLVPQPVRNAGLFDEVCGQGNLGASDRDDLPPQLIGAGCSAALPRGPDNRPKDTGQYGLSARYFATALNDTEFGLYYLRYHSRLPVVSGISVTSSAVNSGRVIVEYPEDIDLFGASFNTTIPGGWAMGGEVSYRPNVPLQLDDVELLFAGLSPLNALIPEPVLHFDSQLGEFGPGEYIRGYQRRDVSQAQITFTKLFGPGNWLRANQMAVVGEIGATHVWDLPDRSELRFEGPGTDTGGGPSAFTGGNLRNPVTTGDGFATAFSWGYRLLVAPTYNNFIGAWNVTPRFAFNHDVTGTSPGPGGNFVAGRKQVTLGVGFDYQSRWRGDVSYTHFFGAGTNNLLGDRDFVAASLSYSF